MVDGSWLMTQDSWLMAHGQEGRPGPRGPGVRQAGTRDGDRARPRAPRAAPLAMSNEPWALTHEPWTRKH